MRVCVGSLRSTRTGTRSRRSLLLLLLLLLVGKRMLVFVLLLLWLSLVLCLVPADERLRLRLGLGLGQRLGRHRARVPHPSIPIAHAALERSEHQRRRVPPTRTRTRTPTSHLPASSRVHRLTLTLALPLPIAEMQRLGLRLRLCVRVWVPGVSQRRGGDRNGQRPVVAHLWLLLLLHLLLGRRGRRMGVPRGRERARLVRVHGHGDGHDRRRGRRRDRAEAPGRRRLGVPTHRDGDVAVRGRRRGAHDGRGGRGRERAGRVLPNGVRVRDVRDRVPVRGHGHRDGQSLRRGVGHGARARRHGAVLRLPSCCCWRVLRKIGRRGSGRAVLRGHLHVCVRVPASVRAGVPPEAVDWRYGVGVMAIGIRGRDGRIAVCVGCRVRVITLGMICPAAIIEGAAKRGRRAARVGGGWVGVGDVVRRVLTRCLAVGGRGGELGVGVGDRRVVRGFWRGPGRSARVARVLRVDGRRGRL